MSTSQQLLLGGAPAAAAYQIQRSLRFNSADSAYLNRTPSVASNRKTYTWAGWVKRSTLDSVGGKAFFNCGANSTTTGYVGFLYDADTITLLVKNSSTTASFVSSAVWRDVSAWYHVVIAIDTTQATASNRLKVYVNNTQLTWSTSGTIDQNLDTEINNTTAFEIGAYKNSSGTRVAYFDGYMTEINFIDGQQLTPSSFGQTNSATGVWEPIAYSGTYGTNGFYLNFSDNSGTTSTTLGKDYSGNGNNWTPNNFSVTAGAGNDSLVDTPTPYGTDTGAGGEVRGNYCTWNPLNKGSTYTLANGNLDSSSSTSSYAIALATFGMTSGKWYWEVTVTNKAAGADIGLGICKEGVTLTTQYLGQSASAWAYATDGKKYNNNTAGTYGSTYTTNDVIGIAFDADNGELKFYKNGTVQNSGTAAYTGLTSGPYFPASDMYNAMTHVVNFGQRPFAYTAPSGYKALCTQNLPTPTIGATSTTQAGKYFNTVLYTGDGNSGHAITGVGFQPDFVWIKSRSAATDHGLYDAVRGVQNQLESNTTTDETTETTGLTAFGTDGFTVGALAQLNTNTATYVAWNWKETATAGFDIVTYTGNGTARTISHNLGVAPNMIIVKARTTASTDQGWPVYHSANTAAPATDYLLLNTTDATADLDTVWNDTAPTSSVFSVGTNANVNANNDTYVAYLFAAVAGYSAFGSYTGNGSTDGPFIYTGFRPKYILVKQTTAASATNWFVWDTSINTYNAATVALMPNSSSAELTSRDIDILSNGFKCRQNDANFNVSSGTYIYAAFAETAFKWALGR